MPCLQFQTCGWRLHHTLELQKHRILVLERSSGGHQMKAFDCRQQAFWLSPGSNFTLPETPHNTPLAPHSSFQTIPFFQHLPAQSLLLH